MLQLSVKTPEGFVPYGEFTAGNDRSAAGELFARLKGTLTPADHVTLFIDLMEKINDVPVSARTIGCTLDELGDNCKLLALHTFRRHTLCDR